MTTPAEGTKHMISQANAVVEMADWENIKYKSTAKIAMQVSGDHDIPDTTLKLSWSVTLTFEVEIEKEKKTITKPA